MVYEWREGFSNSGVTAQIVGESLEQIENKNGEVTKENVLEYARPKKSPLHPAFEWRDDVAAEKYRLEQAKYLIRAVIIRPEESKAREVRAYVNVGNSTQGRFINVYDAMSDETHRSTVLSHALDELRAFRKKYEELSELANVLSAIDDVLATE